MNKIPIVFAFDNNLILPACVSISSLLMNAYKDTFYDIFILHPQIDFNGRDKLDELCKYFPHCQVRYIAIGNEFNNALEIRGITQPTYYRLLIPELIHEYKKVIYADVDIIFQMDLSEVYAINLDGFYLAACQDWGIMFSEKKHVKEVTGLPTSLYFSAGFIMLNNELLLKDKLVDSFKKLSTQNWIYQDQDILNTVCKEKIYTLPCYYNMMVSSFHFLINTPEYLKSICPNIKIGRLYKNCNFHYNGSKPWNGYCINFDIWWEYYRKSPFFDEKFYFDFFVKKSNEQDRFSLWKRIKLLVRYFVYGQIKD